MSASTAAGFGSRLRMERERRTITLASISDNSKISHSLLEALERDDVSRWPSGIFRRSFIRTYAQAIGLDPDVIAREFLERFPDPAGPSAEGTVGDVPATGAVRGGAILKAVRPALQASRGTMVRLTIAAPGSSFAGGRVLQEVKRRWAAAACDVGVVIAIAVVLFLVVNEFWRPFGVIALGYYVGSIVILGNTPGVSLFAPASGRGLDVRHPLESLITAVRSLRRT
jgi:transcriptional regulator with XRE-family HTH domain